MTIQRNDAQEQLDRAVLEALSDGQRHTGDDLMKATGYPSAHVMSSVRRLALEGRVLYTSDDRGRRVYVRTDVERDGGREDGASEE